MWDRKLWPVIAVICFGLACSFGTIAAVQRIELMDSHLHVEWGDVPAWLQGIGTSAAFATLIYVALGWRASEAERLDRQAEQARLIVAERFYVDYYSGQPSHQRYVVVRNHSQSPVLNVAITEIETDLLPSGSSITLMQPVRESVLHAGEATYQAILDLPLDKPDDWGEVGPTELVAFSFTDANGRQWRRVGSKQPVRVLG